MNLIRILISLLLFHGTSSLQSTTVPPLLDVPTYSLSTVDETGRTGMNILTYASPVSIHPKRIWCIGLFKGTVAYENFSKTGEGVLQLLAPEHSSIVKTLGGYSGRDINKEEECSRLGFKWFTCDKSKSKLLPGCSYYLKLKMTQHGMIDCGNHDVVLCVVEDMFLPDDQHSSIHLKTAKLRDLGIITNQGKVAE
jgi:flavin reductase (DIM6/NTAB) family NADH-FMN oxidoreductase RutF